MPLPVPIRTSIARAIRGLRHWPPMGNWLTAGGVFLFFAVVASAIGFGTGLFHYAPALDSGLLKVALIAILLPALGEEFVFRGLLAGKQSDLVRNATAIALFVVWHPINARLFFPQAEDLFGDARFLLIVALLGLTCQRLWQKTGSLWPPVAAHWLAVVLWKGFLDGPRLF
ncbi:MAG: CPBP family glutamic-type intramembrane protease [Hyphomonas sp.]